MGDGDAVQSFHTLKQVVRVFSTWMHWLLPRCRMIETSIVCSLAWGPDADRRAEPLIYHAIEGSILAPAARRSLHQK